MSITDRSPDESFNDSFNKFSKESSALSDKIGALESQVKALETTVNSVSHALLSQQTVTVPQQELKQHETTLKTYEEALKKLNQHSLETLQLVEKKTQKLQKVLDGESAELEIITASAKNHEEEISLIIPKIATARQLLKEIRINQSPPKSVKAKKSKIDELKTQEKLLAGETVHNISKIQTLQENIADLGVQAEKIMTPKKVRSPSEVLLGTDRLDYTSLTPGLKETIQNVASQLQTQFIELKQLQTELNELNGNNIPRSHKGGIGLIDWFINAWRDYQKSSLKKQNKEKISALSSSITALGQTISSSKVTFQAAISQQKEVWSVEHSLLIQAQAERLTKLSTNQQEQQTLKLEIAQTEQEAQAILEKKIEEFNGLKLLQQPITLNQMNTTEEIERHLDELLRTHKYNQDTMRGKIGLVSARMSHASMELSLLTTKQRDINERVTFVAEHLKSANSNISRLQKTVASMQAREEKTVLAAHEKKALTRINQFNTQFDTHVITPLQQKITDLSRWIEVRKDISEDNSADIQKLETDLQHLQTIRDSITGLSSSIIIGMQKEIQKVKAEGKGFAHTYKAISKIAKNTLKEIQEKTIAKTDEVGTALLKLTPSLHKKLGQDANPEFATLIPKYKQGEDNLKVILEHLKKEAAAALSSLQNPNWKTQEAEMTFPNGVVGISRLTPLSKMQTRVKGVNNPMLASGERGTAEGVVNQWSSEYRIRDSKGKEKVLFQGNRSAVLAMDEKHVQLTSAEKQSKKTIKQKFQEINQAKIRQVLSVELDQQLQNPEFISDQKDSLNHLIEIIKQGPGNADLQAEISKGNIVQALDGSYSFPKFMEPLKLDHTTMGLLTVLPSLLEIKDKEGKMWRAEKEALEVFNDKPQELELKVGNSLVKINCCWSVNTYDFGVAEVTSDTGLIGSALGGATDEMNQAAFEKTKLRYLAFTSKCNTEIKKLGNSPDTEEARKALTQRMQKATYLLNQIINHGGVEGFSKQRNAYAIPARLILLENIMNGSVHTHCKSGKDRTSLLDIEIKYLAQQLENYFNSSKSERREIPVHFKDEKLEDKDLRIQIALEGGNLLVTEANTGESGIKTVDRKEAIAKFGEDIAIYLCGDSGLAES